MTSLPPQQPSAPRTNPGDFGGPQVHTPRERTPRISLTSPESLADQCERLKEEELKYAGLTQDLLATRLDRRVLFLANYTAELHNALEKRLKQVKTHLEGIAKLNGRFLMVADLLSNGLDDESLSLHAPQILPPARPGQEPTFTPALYQGYWSEAQIAQFLDHPGGPQGPASSAHNVLPGVPLAPSNLAPSAASSAASGPPPPMPRQPIVEDDDLSDTDLNEICRQHE